MEPFDRRSGGGERAVIRQPELSLRLPRPRGATREHTPKAHRICDHITAGLICFMIVFTPWAFGTTQDWSIWTMNAAGFTLGGILLAKWGIRLRTGYRPPRWDDPAEQTDPEALLAPNKSRNDFLAQALAALTVFLLIYILVSAVNARATFLEWQRRFEYHNCLTWLPHSYDSTSTWHALWMYLGLACFFWAARDWLLGKSARERRQSRHARRDLPQTGPAVEVERAETAELAVSEHSGSAPLSISASGDAHRLELPPRMRLLLWVLCLNGALLALEAILQRLSGTDRLLWLVQPRFNTEGASQFGPYAYRANAASYLNLVWPVCFGFWLVLRRAAKATLRTGRRIGSGSHLVLLPGAVLMAACPIIATTRGGSLVAAASILAVMAVLLWSTRKESFWFRLGASSLFAVTIALAALLGFKDLLPRFQTIFTDQLSRRTEIYHNAVPIAHDFPVLGTGAGTFGSLYHLYRTEVNQDWAGYVHDDWLETRITFGWVGFTAILLALATVFARWFFGRGFTTRWEFAALIWVALGGCLLHGKFDFPFQIYSIVFVFLLLCSMLFCLSRPVARH